METSQRGSQGGGLKKGPWTAAEDAILMDYVKKHGEGNWNSVQKHSGLMRCGKSCRLRWANHLRPNLKKGSFTPDEERIIIDLHAKLGNKWARMASQLPGRTDNEIKNFWNTRLKRRQRAGLPIYPQEFPEESLSSPFRIHQQHLHRQNHQKHHSSSSSSSPFSCRKTSYNNPSLSLLEPIINFASPLDPLQNHFSSFYSSNPTFQFKTFSDHRTPTNNNNSNISLALPLSQYARPSPPAANLPSFNQKFASPATPTPPPLPPSLSYNTTTDFENNMSFTSLIMGGHVEPIDLFPDSKSELPSVQMPPPSPGGGRAGGEATSKNSDNNNNNDIVTETALGNWNSGLLDALLMESQNLSRKDKSDDDKGKRVMDENEEEYMEVTKRVKFSSENCPAGENQYCDDFSSSQSSIGVKPSDQEVIEEMNSMGDDLLSLLDGFPSSTPLPEWYQKTNISDGNSSGDTGGDGVGGGRGVEVDQQETSPVAGTVENNQGVEWSLGSSYWNNMPGIC